MKPGSVSIQHVLGLMQQLAPPELACGWDNVGLLVDAGQPVTAITTTLDITADVVRDAAASGCELIVSHHPVIFDPLKNISAGDVPALLLKNGISAICMHTNLDAAPGGVNDTLAALLGMRAPVPFAEGCGRVGTVDAISVQKLAAFCAETLHSGVKYVDAPQKITRLAEVSGAGGSYLEEALALGATCLVTGEASHHVAVAAQEKGVGLVVAGHWGTEHPIARVLAEYLAANLPDQIRVTPSLSDRDPYTYLV